MDTIQNLIDLKRLPKMKILLIHNYYQEYGGEDREYENEVELLRKRGHDVVEFTANNTMASEFSFGQWLTLPKNIIWSRETMKNLRAVLEREKPDIAHIHNTFFILSLSVYSVCKEFGIPIVQTIQNFRMFCASANFLRKEFICEDCAKAQFALPSIIHRCYHNSFPKTAAVASMISFHRSRKTWDAYVTLFIVVTEFIKNKFIEYGLDAHKLIIKPNFVEEDSGEGKRSGGYALFVGRLHEEKGVKTLLDACAKVKHIPVKLVGDGPLYDYLCERVAANEITNVTIIGKCRKEEVLAWMKDAQFLIIPSEWYEGLPLTLVEAFSFGIPILASRIGSLENLIDNETNGLLFRAGDSCDLAQKMELIWSNQTLARDLGRKARKTYLELYTAEANYLLLMRIYNMAIERN